MEPRILKRKKFCLVFQMTQKRTYIFISSFLNQIDAFERTFEFKFEAEI